MFLLINKPVGITSHDVVDRVRRITGERRVGHAGTLDPFADGLLIVAVGREFTKQLGSFLKLDKKYRATLHLGKTTDTFDRTGVFTSLRETSEASDVAISQTQKPSLSAIQSILPHFTGHILQTPPMYSAKKINGKKLYELARKGIEVERQPVPIEIFSITIISYQYPLLVLDIHCSSGTYIRSLGNDIGATLGCGVYLESLTRTAIGTYSLDDAITLGELSHK